MHLPCIRKFERISDHVQDKLFQTNFIPEHESRVRLNNEIDSFFSRYCI